MKKCREALQKMHEFLAQTTPMERIEIGASMNEAFKKLMIQDIRRHNPGISDVELKQEFFLKMYGEDFSPEQREKIVKHLGSLPVTTPFE